MPASRIVMTPEFRFSFPTLVKPEKFRDSQTRQEKGDPMYSTSMLYEPDSLAKFEAFDEDVQALHEVDIAQVCAAVARAEWPGINLKEEFSAAPGKNWPIRDGDAIADNSKKGMDAYRGMKVINAKSKEEYPPNLYYVEKGELKQLNRLIESDMVRAAQVFVGGFYGRAELKCTATKMGTNKYITFYIQNVIYTRPGERFGGESLLGKARFGGVDGGQSDHDPTEGMDSEIPG